MEKWHDSMVHKVYNTFESAYFPGYYLILSSRGPFKFQWLRLVPLPSSTLLVDVDTCTE
jgi:hypothetical protein